jgi:hypothetical protein
MMADWEAGRQYFLRDNIKTFIYKLNTGLSLRGCNKGIGLGIKRNITFKGYIGQRSLDK